VPERIILCCAGLCYCVDWQFVTNVLEEKVSPFLGVEINLYIE
jgi:hypothetical protein